MVAILVTLMFGPWAGAQLPAPPEPAAEEAVPGTESVESAPVAAPAAVSRVKAGKKKVRRAPPSKIKYAVTKKSFVWFRGIQNNKNVGFLQSRIGVAAPLQSYVLSHVTLQSATNPEKHHDFQTFANNNWIFSRHFRNVGMVAEHQDASGRGNTSARAGVYLRFGIMGRRHTSLILPYYALNDFGARSGRAAALYIASWWNGLLILDGIASYTWKDGVKSTSFTPVVSLRVYDSLRVVSGYTYNVVDETKTETLFAGFELRTYF